MRNANSVPPAAVPHYWMHPGYPYSHGFDAQGTSFDGHDHNSFDPDATQKVYHNSVIVILTYVYHHLISNQI